MTRTFRAAISRTINNAHPAICEDVAQWARERGIPVTILHDAIYDEISAFGVGDPLAEGEIQTCKDDLRRPQELVAIEGAVVREMDGLVILPDGQFCLQGNWYRKQLEAHYAYRRRLPYARRRLKGDIYSLLCLWGSTYFHWFHDVLPRLLFARPRLPVGTRFLLNENPRRYQLDSLKAFGISESDLEIQPARSDTRVERLWFATPLGHCSFTAGEALAAVSKRLKSHFNTDTNEPARCRVYISRAKAGRRQVSNEDDILPVMRNNNFDVLFCEDLSLADQVRIFSNAEIILGPHGAGLTNMLYSSRGSKVGEFYGVESSPCFLVMAKQLGLEYFRLVVGRGGSGAATPTIRVEPGAFSQWLESLLRAPANSSKLG